MDKVYDDAITATEEELTSSRDARIALQWDGQLQLDCQTGGKCTISGTAKDVSEGRARARSSSASTRRSTTTSSARRSATPPRCWRPAAAWASRAAPTTRWSPASSRRSTRSTPAACSPPAG
ncbi:hypothetical protein ACFQXA_16945 [Nocardiopsis composta]